MNSDREKVLRLITDAINELMDATDSAEDRRRFGMAICNTVVARVTRYVWAHKMKDVKVRGVR